MATAPAASEVIYLRPRRGWTDINLREMWRYRELLYFLTWRDIKVRYKQATLGVAWAVIQPLVNIVIFTFIFGGLFGLSKTNDGTVINYPLLSAVGLLAWNLFASALQRSSVSLVGNSNLLTKVYFPRLIIPISSVLSGLVDFGISLLVVLGLMLYYHTPVTWNILWVLPLTLLVLITGLAVGLWLSALNVQYRDVQQMVPFLVTTWMYASPVAYSATLVTGQWARIIYGLNPMAGIIQGFRWAIMGGPQPEELFIASIVMVVILFITGLYYFRRMEKTFADLV